MACSLIKHRENYTFNFILLLSLLLLFSFHSSRVDWFVDYLKTLFETTWTSTPTCTIYTFFNDNLLKSAPLCSSIVCRGTQLPNDGENEFVVRRMKGQRHQP
jgi:hypothetical protein